MKRTHIIGFALFYKIYDQKTNKCLPQELVKGQQQGRGTKVITLSGFLVTTTKYNDI